MGFSSEHRGRGPKVFVPGTGQCLNSTCIRTNQSSEGIRYSVVLTERIRRQCRNTRTIGSSDHNQLHFNINIKSDKTKVKQFRRDFRKGNYKEIRKSLALVDWDDKMKNKTATECWNILRGELDSAIDSHVPMKKQGKRSKKKHLSKEAFRKIRYKQNMWRVYKHTGKDKDYDAYKEALNAATNEVRKSKRNFEQKLVQNIKSDSKSFYAYVRSKQNVRDRVGPL